MVQKNIGKLFSGVAKKLEAKLYKFDFRKEMAKTLPVDRDNLGFEGI